MHVKKCVGMVGSKEYIRCHKIQAKRVLLAWGRIVKYDDQAKETLPSALLN